MDDLADELDEGFLEHLRRLDGVSSHSSGYFRNERAKERYETLLTFSVRKRLAAEYHLANVTRLMLQDISEGEKVASLLDQLAKPPDELVGRVHSVSAKFANVSNHYAFELSAFLEALKSSIDMLAEAASITLPGISANYSITPLLKAANKDTVHPVLAAVNRSRPWLDGLREYRHHLVHRLVPLLRSGYEGESVAGARRSSILPVVVPAITPSYVPDTREVRAMHEDEEGPRGLVISRGAVTGEYDDGRSEVIRYEMDVKPAPGYALLDEFMKSHLACHAAFFSAITSAVEQVAFVVPAA